MNNILEKKNIQVSKQLQNYTKFRNSCVLYSKYYSECFTDVIICNLTESYMSMSVCTGVEELGTIKNLQLVHVNMTGV